MITATIELPDELVGLIKTRGSDINSYIQSQLINPLLTDYELFLEEKLLADNSSDIKQSVDSIKSEIMIDIQTDKEVSVKTEKEPYVSFRIPKIELIPNKAQRS